MVLGGQNNRGCSKKNVGGSKKHRALLDPRSADTQVFALCHNCLGREWTVARRNSCSFNTLFVTMIS